MIKFTSILCFLALICAGKGDKFSFEGYRLIQITPRTVSHINLLGLWEDNTDFDVWNRIKTVEETIDVLLSPKAFDKYEPMLKLANMPFTILDKNIQEKIDQQEKSVKERPKNSNIVGKYARYTEVINYINDIVASNSGLASTYVAGKTHEGRDLRVLVLKTNTSKKSVWLDCGIHSREWVSPSTCIWFIDRLIKDFKNKDPVGLALLNHYEFHVLPLVNPDGYEYTHNTYRLWRKNRRPNTGSSCVGTDLNRNYGHKWMVAGASNNPCSDTYAGPSADSELETIAVEKAINAKAGNWDVFLTLHSYGNFWMFPWGYGPGKPADYDDLLSASRIGADALKKVYGTQYSIGSPATLLYSAAGGSFDWTYAVAGIKYSICLELRPGQTGTDATYGFTLPEDRVPLAGEEAYVGLKAMIDAIRKLNN